MSIYNEPINYVSKAVGSILKQDYSNLELVVVVDDPSNRIAIDLLRSLAKQDKRLKLLINSKNMGLVYSLNKAFKASKGQYIARMDADDISFKSRIREEFGLLTKFKLDLVASNILNIDENDQETGFQTNYPVTDKKIKKCLKYIDCLPHPTWLARREVFSKLNGYRNIMACEDYDFLIRGTYKGFKYGVVKKPLLKYRINVNSISHTNQEIQMLSTYYIQQMYRENKEYSEQSLKKYITTKKGKQQEQAVKEFTRFLDKRGEISILYQLFTFLKLMIVNGGIISREAIIKIIRFRYTKA